MARGQVCPICIILYNFIRIDKYQMIFYASSPRRYNFCANISVSFHIFLFIFFFLLNRAFLYRFCQSIQSNLGVIWPKASATFQNIHSLAFFCFFILSFLNSFCNFLSPRKSRPGAEKNKMTISTPTHKLCVAQPTHFFLVE